MKKLSWLFVISFLLTGILTGFAKEGVPNESPSNFHFDIEPGEPPPPWKPGEPPPTWKPGSDLATPLEHPPISIDDALGRRLKIIGKNARNAIIFVADGLSAANIRLARDILVGRQNTLEVDKFPVIGRMINYPADGSVSDSAAAATSLATGKTGLLKKISLDQNNKPIPTIFESAKSKGLRVGLVSDTRITHATPAAFAGHVANRDDEEMLAQQLIQSEFHVLLGGGRNFFLPQNKGGVQTSNQDLLELARLRGYRLVGDKKELEAAVLAKPEKTLGLFSPSFMPDPWEKEFANGPTLAEMTASALSLLGSDGSRFLLMVEAGKIDFANHAQDAAAVVGQMKVMDDALKILADYVKCNPDTLLIVVSDHATAGMAILEDFDPEVFRARATSTFLLANQANHKTEQLASLLKSTFPGMSFSVSDLAALDGLKDPGDFETQLGSLVFRQFGIAFISPEVQRNLGRTHGHTGEDLFIHAMGAHQGIFGGVMRIWEIPGRVAAVLGIPLS